MTAYDPSQDPQSPYGQPGAGGPLPPAPPPMYGGGYMPAPTPPPNYLVWAILTTVLCCLPFGIASIVYASRVNSDWATGNYAGAQQASASAKKFAIIAAIVGGAGSVLYGILIAAGVLTFGSLEFIRS